MTDKSMPCEPILPKTVDVLVVGAGFGGLGALHKFRGLGLDTHVVEAADDLGGVWYWNRYPGARCDVDSVDYCFSFDLDLVRDWNWTERYPAQPEILAYLNHVADRYDMRRDISFETAVTALSYDDATHRWTARTAGGATVVATWVVMATGQLSVANVPEIPGLDTFNGPILHTGNWPHDGDPITGRRVGVIGTGSSGVQSIPQIAKSATHLSVFQRTAHYALPARNAPLEAAYVQQMKDEFVSYREAAKYHPSGSHRIIGSNAVVESDPETVQAKFEECWISGGVDIVTSYRDIRSDLVANETAAEFVRKKIREIVADPAIAERLSPRGYPFASKRIVLEIDYWETYNLDNVELVDVDSDPIREVTAHGVRTESAEYELDVLVLATGFDAFTGALARIDIRGTEGRTLRDAWAEGPKTNLGIGTHGFPSLFFLAGAGSPSVLANVVIAIEQHLDWIGNLLQYLREHGLDRVEADATAQDEWVAHVNELAAGTLFAAGKSWYLGANIPGKPRVFMAYPGGLGTYRALCEEIAADGYPGFHLN